MSSKSSPAVATMGIDIGKNSFHDRSPVKVPKLRTGSGSRSGLTAAMCRVAPMSIAAALVWTGDIAIRDRLVLGINSSLAEWVEEMGCATDQFPNRDRHRASPFASTQQPTDHV
jgi:hypothetical protein